MAPLNIGVGKYKVQTRNTENAKYKKNEAGTTVANIANYKSRKAHVAEIMLCEQIFATWEWEWEEEIWDRTTYFVKSEFHYFDEVTFSVDKKGKFEFDTCKPYVAGLCKAMSDVRIYFHE